MLRAIFPQPHHFIPILLDITNFLFFNGKKLRLYFVMVKNKFESLPEEKRGKIFFSFLFSQDGDK